MRRGGGRDTRDTPAPGSASSLTARGCPPPELSGLRQRVQALDKDLAKANKVIKGDSLRGALITRPPPGAAVTPPPPLVSLLGPQ